VYRQGIFLAGMLNIEQRCKIYKIEMRNTNHLRVQENHVLIRYK